MASRSPSTSPTRTSIDEYHCDGCSFKLVKALGSGSTGDVYLAQEVHHKKSSRKSSSELCALKIVNLVDKATTKQAQLRSEVSALRTLGKHPNIVGLLRYGYDPVESSSFLQLSYASGGDLLSRIEKKPFTEAEAIPLFHGILSAVSHAHSRGICHRDLKLENILLAENGAAVVADWGLSAQFSPSSPLTKDCGSLHYAAPEILSASSYYGHLVDSFSLGILFFAMVTGCFPFFGNSPRERFLDIVTRKRLPFPSSMSAPLKDLIAQLLCVSPTLRMTATQALQHQFFDSIKPVKTSTRLFDVIVPPVSVPSGADSSKKSPVAIVSKLFSSKSSKTTRAEKQVSDDMISV